MKKENQILNLYNKMISLKEIYLKSKNNIEKYENFIDRDDIIHLMNNFNFDINFYGYQKDFFGKNINEVYELNNLQNKMCFTNDKGQIWILNGKFLFRGENIHFIGKQILYKKDKNDSDAEIDTLIDLNKMQSSMSAIPLDQIYNSSGYNEQEIKNFISTIYKKIKQEDN